MTFPTGHKQPRLTAFIGSSTMWVLVEDRQLIVPLIDFSYDTNSYSVDVTNFGDDHTQMIAGPTDYELKASFLFASSHLDGGEGEMLAVVQRMWNKAGGGSIPAMTCIIGDDRNSNAHLAFANCMLSGMTHTSDLTQSLVTINLVGRMCQVLD